MSEEKSIHELLCAVVLGEASPEEVQRVERELARDPDLRAERERLEATIGLVRGALADEESLSGEARAELLARSGLSRRVPLWSRTAVRVAAAVLAFAGGALAVRQLGGPPPPAGPAGPATDVARTQGSEPRFGEKAKRDEAERGSGLALADAERELAAGLPRESARDPKERLVADAKDSRVKKNEGQAAPNSRVATVDGSQDLSQDFSKVWPPAPDTLSDAPFEESTRADGGERQRRAEAPLSAEGGSGRAPLQEAEDLLAGLGYVAVESSPASGSGTETKDTTLHNVAGIGSNPYRSVSPGAVPPGGATAAEETDFLLGRAANAPASDEHKLVASDTDSSLPLGATSDWYTWYDASSAQPSPADSVPPASSAPSGPAGPSGPTSIQSDSSMRKFQELDSYSVGSDARDPIQLARLDAVRGVLADLANGRADEAQRLAEQALALDDAALCDFVLTQCRRRPQESPSAMFFRFWGDNPFEWTAVDRLSTFSVDVDTASYALARSYLSRGLVPPKAAVRTEEFVNYFPADVPAPVEGDFAVHTDLAPSRFGGGDPSLAMLRVVVRAREVAREAREPLSLTFVVDTSGSMQTGNRLELVKHALRLLVAELGPEDSIALVAFSQEARLVLPMTPAVQRAVIEAALQGLTASGSTNAEAGLKLGYGLATSALRPEAHHRVVLLSDGVANVGQTDQDRIAADVAGQRARGVYLNTIGVGMGNHNDVFLEQLADKGDGLCNYVDSEREAYRAIVENFTSAFVPVARDVKVQVEFDPAQVSSYRLLGYENRAVADRDFRNDRVDAGEVGSGHQVTALYELVRVQPAAPGAEADAAGDAGALATVRVRWKPAGRGEERAEAATELAQPVFASSAAASFADAPAGYRRAVIVAQFAELLRRSVHARGDSLDDLIGEARALAATSPEPEFRELTELLGRARQAILAGLPHHDELVQAVDLYRQREILRARLDDVARVRAAQEAAAARELLERLERENRELEGQIRGLLGARLR